MSEPTTVAQVIARSHPNDKPVHQAQADAGWVVCPCCDGSGESEHWTTCPLCDFSCLVPPHEARAFNDAKLYRLIADLAAIGLSVSEK